MSDTSRKLVDGTVYEVGSHPDLPPPAASTGIVGWIRANLFSSFLNSLLTLVVLAGLILVVPGIYNWSVGSATSHGETNATCDIADKTAFVQTKWDRLNVEDPNFKNRTYKTLIAGMGNTVRALGEIVEKGERLGNTYPEEFVTALGSVDLVAIGAAIDEAAAAKDLNAIDLQVQKLAPIADWANDNKGFCWTLIKKRANYFAFYRYDKDQQWRVWLVWGLLALALIPLLVEKIPYRKEGLLYSLAFPFIAFVLLLGYQIPSGLNFIALNASSYLGNPLVSWGLAGSAIAKIFTNLFSFEISAAILSLASAVYYLLSPILLIAIFILRLIAPLVVGWFVLRSLFNRNGGASMVSLVRFGIGTFIALLLAYFCWFDAAETGGNLMVSDSIAGGGLSHVKTADWGGLMLTMVIGITGIIASLPLGIVLALGRRSKLRIISIVCVGFIEFVRAVPLITILFMASTMLPLFGPEGWNPDKLMRALVGVALFSSAYMAEVIRGGLQALPKGQYEGAQSMGLSYWKMIYLVVLPQALRIVIPGIVNTFIGLFKDTTLVIIIGMKDLLGAGVSSTTNANWQGLDYEAYITVALIFFIFCFAMSRYSIWLEDKLKKATTH